MSDDDIGDNDKPPWQQIADAGFADTVERHGFRRTGKFLWRKPGDGIRWSLVITKEPADLQHGFQISYGVEWRELDDLTRSIGHGPCSDPLPYSSARGHSWTTLSADINGYINLNLDRFWQQELERRAENFRWRDIFKRRPDKKEFGKILREEQPFRRRTHASGYLYQTLVGAHPGDVAAYCSGEWRRLAVPEINEIPDYQTLYKRIWGPEGTRGQGFVTQTLSAAKLAGDWDHINRSINRYFSRALQSRELFEEELKARGSLEKANLRSLKLTKEQRIDLWQAGAIKLASNLLILSEKLDLGLKDPGLDLAVMQRILDEHGY